MTIYIYVKTHLDTGLKYLGKTSRIDPHKYPGSGIRWKNHLHKHGYNYKTEILKECSSDNEAKYWGLYYSNLWNVVESNEWANLTPEMGNGGSMKGTSARMYGKFHSLETKEKIGKANLGKKLSKETKMRMKLNHKGMTGKTFSISAKEKISQSLKGRKKSPETILKMKNSSTAKKSIFTPFGQFVSLTEAALFLKIHKDTLKYRMKKYPEKYYLIC